MLPYVKPDGELRVSNDMALLQRFIDLARPVDGPATIRLAAEQEGREHMDSFVKEATEAVNTRLETALARVAKGFVLTPAEGRALAEEVLRLTTDLNTLRGS